MNTHQVTTQAIQTTPTNAQADKILNDYISDRKARVAVYDKDEQERKNAFNEKIEKLDENNRSIIAEFEKLFLAKHEEELLALCIPDSEEDKIRHNLKVVLCKRKYEAQRKERESLCTAVLQSTEYVKQKADMHAAFKSTEDEITAAQTELGRSIYEKAFNEWKATIEWKDEDYNVARKQWENLVFGFFLNTKEDKMLLTTNTTNTLIGRRC